MGVDAADSIQAGNSLEKMLAHQLAAAHRTAMEQMRLSSYDRDPAAQSKRLNAAAKMHDCIPKWVAHITQASSDGKPAHHSSIRQCR
jgi:hypothetical protein